MWRKDEQRNVSTNGKAKTIYPHILCVGDIIILIYILSYLELWCYIAKYKTYQYPDVSYFSMKTCCRYSLEALWQVFSYEHPHVFLEKKENKKRIKAPFFNQNLLVFFLFLHQNMLWVFIRSLGFRGEIRKRCPWYALLSGAMKESTFCTVYFSKPEVYSNKTCHKAGQLT